MARRKASGWLSFLHRREKDIDIINKAGNAYQHGRSIVTDLLKLGAAILPVSVPVVQGVAAPSFLPAVALSLEDKPGLRLILFVVFVGLIGYAFPTLVRVVERWADGEWARVLAVFVGLVLGYALACLGAWMAPTSIADAQPWFLALVAVALVCMMFIARLRFWRARCRHELEVACRTLALVVVPLATSLFATMFLIMRV